MRKRSFTSFLKQYTNSLSSDDSLSLAKAERQGANDARFLAVCALWLFFDRKASLVLERNRHRYPTLDRAWSELRTRHTGLAVNDVSKYVTGLDRFDEMRKAYESYRNLILDKEASVKRILRMEILSEMERKHITKYRIYHRLKLNPGNTNDFLKNDHVDKLSTERIRSILAYCRDERPCDASV